LKLKERENEQATHIEDTQRLVTEIEMLKVVLYLVCRKQSNSSRNYIIITQKRRATTLEVSTK
jgi:hypothetical protein